ncbi:MAG: hypothetical protein AB1941_16110 [Gemmatimonadota bacterium]
MPVVAYQLVPANAGSPGYAVAKELARQTVAQFGAVRGLGVGIGGGSCCAAVALAPAGGAGFPAGAALNAFGPPPGALPLYGGALPYGIAYGNSQLAAGGLALGPLGGHAERAALTGAGGLALYTLPGTNHAVLFVELTPCGPCATWLGGGGGGVANPYNGVINGGGATTLNVWWRWVYPGDGGVPAMNAFHAMTVAAQLAQINGATW